VLLYLSVLLFATRVGVDRFIIVADFWGCAYMEKR
jgi:hypothetical protein